MLQNAAPHANAVDGVERELKLIRARLSVLTQGAPTTARGMRHNRPRARVAAGVALGIPYVEQQLAIHAVRPAVERSNAMHQATKACKPASAAMWAG